MRDLLARGSLHIDTHLEVPNAYFQAHRADVLVGSGTLYPWADAILSRSLNTRGQRPSNNIPDLQASVIQRRGPSGLKSRR
jgi:hypothetical protein